MRRALSVLLFVLAALLASCSHENDAQRILEEATVARNAREHAKAATLYEQVCSKYPKTNACAEAAKYVVTEQAAGASELFDKKQYGAAKAMAERAAATGTGEPAERAKKLLEDDNLIMGVRFEEAERTTPERALPTMEEVAASKTRVAAQARAWLETNRPVVLIEQIREKCKTKPPSDDCGTLADKLVKLHPKTKEAKEAEALLKSFAKSPFDEAQQLDWSGKLVEAAGRYDEVCKRSPGTETCKTAAQRADSARLRAATAAAGALKFAEAKALYDVVAKTSTIEANKKQAQAQLDSEALKSGLALEDARTHATADKRAALAKMEDVAKSNSAAGVAARAWLTKERPALLLEDVQTTCKALAADCPTKAKHLLSAHPGTPQATDARKLLGEWENEPIVRAESLLKDGNVLGAAAEYDRVCPRAPESAACQKAAPLAIDTHVRGAQEAAALGKFIDAKKSYEAAALATKDDAKKASIKKALEAPAFLEGLAKEMHASSIEVARTRCAEVQPDCGALIAALTKNGGADAEEAKKLRALSEQANTESAAASAKIEGLLSECREMNAADAQTRCWPAPFVAANGAPVDSVVDRVGLATAFATGASGVPTPSLARRGLLLLGLVFGVTFGIGVQLLRQQKILAGLLVPVAAVLVVVLGVSLTHSFEKVRLGYASVGLETKD